MNTTRKYRSSRWVTTDEMEELAQLHSEEADWFMEMATIAADEGDTKRAQRCMMEHNTSRALSVAYARRARENREAQA